MPSINVVIDIQVYNINFCVFYDLQVQFSVDRTLTGNEAHRIFDQKKIDYALNSNKNSIGKHSADDEGMGDARSYKHRRGEDDEPQKTR